MSTTMRGPGGVSGEGGLNGGEDFYCIQCAYCLRGLPGETPVCPECGTENPFDERRVDLAVVRKMRRRLTRWVQWSDACVAFGLLATVPVMLGVSSCMPLVMATAAAWVILYQVIVGSDGSGSSGVRARLALAQVVAVGALGLAGALSYFAYGLNRRLQWWQGESESMEIFVLSVGGMLVAAAVCAWPYRVCRRQFTAFLDDRAVEMAQRWHAHCLRTPPDRRSKWHW